MNLLLFIQKILVQHGAKSSQSLHEEVANDEGLTSLHQKFEQLLSSDTKDIIHEINSPAATEVDATSMVGEAKDIAAGAAEAN